MSAHPGDTAPVATAYSSACRNTSTCRLVPMCSDS